MAYVQPTAAAIKIMFPEFAAVDDAVIDAKIAESLRWVDDSWIEGDRAPAMSYWVAGKMQLQGLGTSTAAKLAAVGDFTSIKSGDLQVQRQAKSNGGGSAGQDPLFSTDYGQTYLSYLRRSKPPIGIF